MSTIKKYWNWLSELGLSDKHSKENALIKLYNQMCVLTVIGGVEVLIIAIASEVHIAYIYISILVLINHSLVIVFNAYGKYYTARFLISIFTPIWVTFSYVYLGGFFSQSLIIGITLAITYVAFRRRHKIFKGLVVFILGIYFSGMVYVSLYGSYLPNFNFHYDEYVVFIGSIGWLFVVFTSFIKEREGLIADLKNKNKQLQHTSEELERFTYIASHDLKSPLRTITSFIGLIERDIEKGNIDKLGEKLHFVKSGAEQMNFLVQDILELSQLKELQKAKRQYVDLNLILEKAKTNLTEEVSENNAFVVASDLPHFYCNEVEFLLLFQNFIQNGIKYNESSRPVITIDCFQTDKELNISFRDNGIGIEEKYYEHIFQFFKRLHTSIEYQGTGLGLGLCKKIITNYDGTVDVDSVIGDGTIFTICLPIISEVEIASFEEEYEEALTT